jgi:hypothetical protein
MYASFILEYIYVARITTAEGLTQTISAVSTDLEQQDIDMATTFSSTVCKIILIAVVAMVALIPTGELPLIIPLLFSFLQPR